MWKFLHVFIPAVFFLFFFDVICFDHGNNVSLFVVAIYQEFVKYHFVTNSWLHLKPVQRDSKYLRILIVADPQLIGYRNDLPGILGSIARYDADSYLAKGYYRAVNFHKPDMIIFLGDLFDEGLTATADDFLSTIERFHGIFPIPNNALVLPVPGDNDVGGEGIERFSNVAQRRFLRYFDTSKSQMKFIGFHFIKLYQANVMSGEYALVGHLSPNATEGDVISIVVSHFPLLNTMNFGTGRILQNVQPHLVLSAHDHDAQIVLRKSAAEGKSVSVMPVIPGKKLVYSKVVMTKSARRMRGEDNEDDSGGHPVQEIVTPTCSYRMGVRHMGYGAMIIEQLGDKSIAIKYTILWTPDRYGQLYNYLGILFFSLLIIFCYCGVACCKSSLPFGRVRRRQ